MQLGGILAETGMPSFAAGLAVLITGLALFDPVAQLVGGHGVSFNPATSACFAAAGKGSWRSHAQRMVRLRLVLSICFSSCRMQATLPERHHVSTVSVYGWLKLYM